MLKTTSYLFFLAITFASTQQTYSLCGNFGNCDTNSNTGYKISNCNSADYLLRNGYVKLGDHYYYFSKEAKTWHDAALFCQQNGSKLARPLNKLENDYLRTYIKANFPTPTGFYFGANDILNENHWYWGGTNTTLDFTDWAPSQPDNAGGAEHCAHYWKAAQWKWDDWWCYLALNFICQADPATYKICS